MKIYICVNEYTMYVHIWSITSILLPDCHFVGGLVFGDWGNMDGMGMMIWRNGDVGSRIDGG